MKPLKNHVSLSLDSDVIEAFKVLAEKEERSLSQYINIVLKNHVKSLEGDRKK